MKRFAALRELSLRIVDPNFDYEADRLLRQQAREEFIRAEYSALPTRSRLIIALEDVCQKKS